MNKRNCINMTGLMKYESPIFEYISRHEKISVEQAIDKYSSEVRHEYCTYVCPVIQRCKFENRFRNSRLEHIK